MHARPAAFLVLSISSVAQAQSLPGPREQGTQAWRERPLFVVRSTDSPPFPGFGYALAGGADVDADGTPDLVVGAPYEGPSHAGRAKVFSGATGALLLPPLEHRSGWHVGFSVALIGDINGDRLSEILVGDPMLGGVGPGGTGQAFVFSGADGTLHMHLLGDESSDEFGSSVSGLDDIDGDLIPDFAVGAVDDHDFSNGPGYVRLFSGATGSEIRTYTTTGTHRRYGQSLANAGDVNGDLVPDLLLGASAGSGFVQMRSGADGALLWQRSGGSPSSYYGWSVAFAGDVDADGSADVVVGAPVLGLVRVLRASDGAFVKDVTGPSGDFFGGAVAGLGDVNADGHADLAIGAKWADSPTQTFAGAAWIRSGADSSVLAAYFGRLSGDRLGFALAPLGDVDGDEITDLAIGANQEGTSRPGLAAVFSGALP